MEYGIASGAAYTIAIDPLTNWSRREVDSRGNVRFEGRYDAVGTILTSARYEYNALGELLVAYDHQGNPLTVEYDLAGRRTAIETKDAGRKEYHYDAADNLVRETDNVLRGRGESIAYEYDGMNRLLTIDYPRSADTRYVYGAPNESDNRAGRVTSVTDESGTIAYTYGSLGETTSEERRITRLTPGYQGSPESARMAYEGDYLGRMQRITYPDNEVVTYGYDRGGQIKSVTGRRFTTDFNYVVDVAYDEYGQRSYIEYGNGVHTTYVYDAYRRLLKSIETEYERNGNSIEYQNIIYRFDAVGNVLGYENKTNRYETSQTYTYDGLYQLRTANGRTVNRSEGLGSCPAYTSTYKQEFEFDSIGNMTKKVSTSAVSPKRTIGAGLNYTYDPYDYYAGYPHRLERVGNMYYRYDGNGNVIAEREGGHAQTDSRNATVYNDGDLYYTDYGFGLFQEGQTDTKVYERKYTWNERNLMSSSVDRQYAVTYRYGADGQRAAKYAVRGTTSVETMYFNQFWSSRTTATSEMLESKHIFVGTSRVVTKLHRKGDDSVDYEGKNRYYYHSDHLGSAQLVTDFKGLEYERIEYTPYGELWVEKTIAGSERLPFRFTGKEFDEETGLYYYGARYLDPKVSRWLSTDPAVGEYIPSAPVNDEARKRNGNLPGMGGIYNLVNFHLYHYAGNNPVRYIDPDGRELEWVKGKDVTDEQFQKIQDEASALMQTDTVAGKRLKELSDSTTRTVKINVVKDTEEGSYVKASNEMDAYDGTGTNSTVFIDITQEGKYSIFGPGLDIRATLAHELSGHAYANHKGISPLNPKASKEVIEGSLRGMSEAIAVAMENEYRVFLGLRQRKVYKTPYATFSMPLYDSKKKGWTLNGKVWR
jgi:RHS repeat-associated protein